MQRILAARHSWAWLAVIANRLSTDRRLTAGTRRIWEQQRQKHAEYYTQYSPNSGNLRRKRLQPGKSTREVQSAAMEMYLRSRQHDEGPIDRDTGGPVEPVAKHGRWGLESKPLKRGIPPQEEYHVPAPTVKICEYCRQPHTESSREHYLGIGLTLRQKAAGEVWNDLQTANAPCIYWQKRYQAQCISLRAEVPENITGAHLLGYRGTKKQRIAALRILHVIQTLTRWEHKAPSLGAPDN